MKRIAIVTTCLLSFLSGGNLYAQTKGEYKPRYWTESDLSYQPTAGILTPTAIQTKMADMRNKGWGGVLYWGASYEEANMQYYYRSPFLEKQSWAKFMGDGLTPLAAAAHKNDMKVMVNIEGVNPYHWQQHHWTPGNIRMAVKDLVAGGADAVFEECFETKPAVFSALAKTLMESSVDYISGTDPMLLREHSFATLWRETGVVNMYNYYIKRDKLYSIAALAQHGTLGYGWAKYWGKRTSMMSPVDRNWGIATEYSPAVISYLCMIRALQFRVDNFIVFGGLNTFDPAENLRWISSYTNKQEKDRPTLNIVVLLPDGNNSDAAWNRLFNSGDAITAGAFNGGYNIVVSDKVLPADAYWIYTPGGDKDVLPAAVVSLFNGKQPVFIQAASNVPGGNSIDPGWKTVLEKCGVDGTKAFKYAPGTDHPSDVSLPGNQEEEIPYSGYYNNVYLRFTGTDAQRGTDLRSGTIIPAAAISGKVISYPNTTYGKGPYIVGKDNKYLVTTTSLNWEVAYPISHLLSGAGILPSSNVWGIAGKKMSALLAVEATELVMNIPGVKDGARIHVVIRDKMNQPYKEETILYKAPYTQLLREYDFILIDVVEE